MLDSADDMVFAEPEDRPHARYCKTKLAGSVKVNATKTKGDEESVPTKQWQRQLCRRDLGAVNSLHIP